ncbi:cytochrome c oxidase accessory protein CcoG [Alterisphingorhabdus coralli]|uniref:Cytochrome c oxidase accessory protein CcoG n=1 Tax=Alterisphingorhabdus coralli TaxID=3071408 RepID=A0AA97I018_9SPHN|nr:cytochrome c oxidase accessory protein CcoG [Parasphingorhabdus sp. SCSIO 66989]WOE75334.1 cytochrome c oxidase accessory protein CcoG [Parasphingorhabdus sp. SCSIO 66989]
MANPDITAEPERHIDLYAARKDVFPKAVNGFFRRLKWQIMAVTLAVYYITPWIRWDRGPYAPDQAVLVDLANRRFYFFSIEIWPHEFYYVAGMLVMAGIGLFLITSAVGRAWCGYACPQTVWTDLFQHVERWVDGDRNAQFRLKDSPWNFTKVRKRLTKWGIWLFIAFWTGGAWIMYFADAPTLVVDFWQGEAPFVAYATVGILTAITFIFGGFMREQVCIYMCPWPRIQTAMMDEKSLMVTYKDWRGEPRGSVKKAQKQPGAFGDCVDCNQCVAVCPTGIDIREGPQIGCITCALCIDACDTVMEQVGRPRGLIDYITEEDTEREKAGEPARANWKMLLRPRTLAYFTLWASIGMAMLFVLGNRSRLDLAAQQDRSPPFVQLSNGDVRNSFTVKLRNMENRPRDVIISVSGLEGATAWSDTVPRRDGQTSFTASVPADSVGKLQLFVVAPRDGAPGEELTITARGADAAADDSKASDSESFTFERPGQ